MLTFLPITEDDFGDFLRLYRESFPWEERREYVDENDLERFLEDKKARFLVFVCKCNDQFVGFITVWDFPDYIYVEHAAVVPEFRGEGIGERMFGYIKERFCKSLILEVEPPEISAMAARRIGFYKRIGFDLRDEVDYLQPPYHQGQEPLPLKLMTYGNVELTNSAVTLSPILREVYGVCICRPALSNC